MPRRLITFDVYTALADLRGSLLPVLDAHLGGGEHGALLGVWRSRQLELTLLANSLARGRPSFRDLTGLALDYALAAAGLAADAPAREALLAAWDRLRPWPEAEAVIAALKARGYAVGLLSNGDEAMLRAVASGWPFAFDHVLASDQAGWYKPHPSVYALPRERLGVADAEVLHVAGSARDVMGARAAGLACAWSNRDGDRVLDPALAANVEGPDLRVVLDAL